MAKSINNDGFEDYTSKLKKMKLSPDRKNLKPRPKGLTEEQYLCQSIADGHKMLADEEKNSVKPPLVPSHPDSVKLDNKLGEISKNAYARAHSEVLNKMVPKTRAIIEEMERTGNTCNPTYDKFAREVTILGDRFSSGN